LAEPLDIHTGGVDHIGTHHTNEMAQTEAAFNTQLAHYWLHNNHMMVNGQKISKSLGNGYTIQDLIKKGFSAYDFKFLVLGSHYRSQTNFTWDSLAAAQQNLAEINAWADLVHQPTALVLPDDQISELKTSVVTALSTDLNSPTALAAINKAIPFGAPTKDLLEFMDKLLGLDFAKRSDITPEQKILIAQRQQARDKNDWPEADRLRQQLEDGHIEINDTPSGPVWRRI
jgi:cysteinyl-tRNA synthetase